jgi:arginyl-tRNA synthetase
VRAAIVEAFGADHERVDPAIRRSTFADYQANASLALGAALKRPPRTVAEALRAKLDLAGIAQKVEIAGPGYLNIVVDAACLSREVERIGADARLGVEAAAAPDTVVIDYSSPNVAKELHVGHLRGTILGDSLARTLEHLGHRVIRQNHLGDWGTPFGMLLETLTETGGDARFADDGNELYKQSRARFEADPEFAARARKRVVALQAGDPATLRLWHELVGQSRRYLAGIYAKLGVKLADGDIAGESLYNPILAEVVAELRARGMVTESEGAQCVFLDGFLGKTGEPLPLIIQKQDGGYGYATTDLAAIRYRVQALHGTRVLYVVGAPQRNHFEMVFAAARRAGWLAPPVRAEHVEFASVLGADKKMFRTRSGETLSLVSLLDEACARAGAILGEKNPELEGAARADLARQIGIGAVKYADLSTDRFKDYVFDWDRMLAFDGNTAPYLQYAHARIRSILRRAEGEASPVGSAMTIAIAAPAERALALDLLDFDATVRAVADDLQPHKLCAYLYALARSFTAFYDQCPVLRADDADQRRSRCALSAVTAATLARGLDLLGIDAPDAM